MQTSSVTYIQNNRIRKNGKLDVEQLSQTLIAGLTAHFAETDHKKVWKSLFTTKDLIVIKVNCLAGRGLSTHSELVWIIISQLEQIGIPKKNIIILDRSDRDLKRAGYKILTSRFGVRCGGNDSLGYDPNLLIHKKIGSMISKTIVQADAIINLPVLKDHGIVGMSGAMKNFFGVIHNPNKYHLNVGDPFIPDLCSHNYIKDKVRLTIFDSLTAQYEGGPPYMPQYAINDNSLLISQDMVALDRIGWSLIEQWRSENNLPSLKKAGREPKYILTGADKNHRLGEANLDRINFKKIRI